MSVSYDKTKMPQRVNEYITYLNAVTDRSGLTIEEYVRDLRLFFEFYSVENGYIKIENDPDGKTPQDHDLSFIDDTILSKVTLSDLLSFLAYCNEQRSNSTVTRARKCSSLRGFFSFISNKMHYIPLNPAAELQVSMHKKELPKYLTLEQSERLLDAVNGKDKERDYCILTLFLNCGLRLAELVGLNLSDFDLEERTLCVTGKGNKQRMLYLNNSCVDAISAYLKVRPHDGIKGEDRDALFISRLKKRMGRQAVQLMVYHYLDEIGLEGKHYSVHKLRHTAATLMYKYGDENIMVIKDVLGHSSLASTQIYTHIENKEIKEAIQNNPLSGEKKDKNG